MLNVKSLLPAAALVLPLILSACGGGGSSAPLNEVEPANCEVSGQSFGIVGGNVLQSGNDLSSSTVLIVYKTSKGEHSMCTGTLIAQDKVLTAAHCTDENGGGAAILFSNNGACAVKAQSRTVRQVVSEAVHPNYRYSGDIVDNAPSDFAVLKFSGSLPEGYKVRTLPNKYYSIKNSNDLVMTGYGRTDDDSSDSSDGDATLRFTTAAGSRLATSYYSADKKKVISVKGAHVVEQSYNGVCKGDSGGPLYTYDNGQLVLIGVVSAGVDNHADRYARNPRICHGVSIFGDVRAQLEWITRQRDTL